MIADVVKGIFEGVVKPVLDKFVPDASQRLEAELLFFKQAHAIDLAQIEVNKAEAANPSVFVAGWRPASGWVCVASLAYAVVFHDVFNWVLQIAAAYTGHAVPVLPEPNMTLTFDLLLGLLGMGGLRTYEKLNKK